MLLAAGLEGVRNKMDPGESADYDADALSMRELKERGVELLPRTLEDALDLFKESKLTKKILGEALHKEFYEARKLEWETFSKEHSFEKQEITRWEIERYIDC